MKTYSWEYLLELAKVKEYQLLKLRLCSNISLPYTLNDIKKFYFLLKDLIPLRLVNSVVLAHILTNHKSSPEFVLWARNEAIFSSIIPDLSEKEIIEARWCKVPLLVLKDDICCIFYLVLGAGSFFSERIFPLWAEDVFSSEVKESLFRFSKAFDCRFYVFPLIPENFFINGRSWELSFVLFLFALKNFKHLSSDFLATGALDTPSWKVLPVENVEKKLEVARKEGASLFLYPRGCILDAGHEGFAIPVINFEDAWMWVKLYNKDNFLELKKLEVMNSPEGFVNNWSSISLESLTWFFKNRFSASLVEGILSSRELAHRFVFEVYQGVENRKKTADFVLKKINLMGDRRLEEESEFLWCVANFKYASFCGDVKNSEYWADLAESLTEKVISVCETEVVNFLNSKLVAERHNTYTFSPDLPEYFNRILKQQEKIQKLIGSPREALGRLYGTVAQNYGFCGSAYLLETEKYVRFAQYNFGDGKISQLKNHWKRTYAYLVFAYLDAGKISEARKSLLIYLGVKNLEEVCYAKWLKKTIYPYSFYHYVLARFLADSVELGHDVEKVIDWCINIWTKYLEWENKMTSHPFQLFFYNLGRIFMKMKKENFALKAFEKSIKLSFTLRKDTILPMGLLGISKLEQLSVMNRDYLRKAEKILNGIGSGKIKVNKSHFEELLDDTIKQALLKLIRDPGKYFPFAYR